VEDYQKFQIALFQKFGSPNLHWRCVLIFIIEGIPQICEKIRWKRIRGFI